ncbi:hypothetical protein TREES_T100006173 [Tupaia chinensis]|uniref:Uncharacterized protein n=1 Tax=Tupaia chinensis TaxID=246437 RepID=L9LAT0_TUPCH|nr:hypothetical protein TREES_T100006173 [Tupaia chinensis]
MLTGSLLFFSLLHKRKPKAPGDVTNLRPHKGGKSPLPTCSRKALPDLKGHQELHRGQLFPTVTGHQAHMACPQCEALVAPAQWGSSPPTSRITIRLDTRDHKAGSFTVRYTQPFPANTGPDLLRRIFTTDNKSDLHTRTISYRPFNLLPRASENDPQEGSPE